MKKLLAFAMLLLLSAGIQAGTWSSYNTRTRKIEPVRFSMNVKGSPKLLVGPDDREEITGQGDEVGRAVVTLAVWSFKEKKWKEHCSGALIAPNLVLTASHCIMQLDEKTKKMKMLSPMRIYAVGFPFFNKSKSNIELEKNVEEAVKAAPLYANVAEMWFPTDYPKILLQGAQYTAVKSNDIAILILDEPIGNTTGYLRVGVRTDKLLGTNIAVFGKSGKKPAHTLWKSVGKIGRVEEDFVWHDADTEPGNSGGPIIAADNKHTIFALNNFNRRNQNPPNGGKRITFEDLTAIANAQARFSPR